jgi:D-amino-acid dehydrogenase
VAESAALCPQCRSGHIGLSTGPITGRTVADLADRRRRPLPIAPFARERFV